MSDRWKFIDVDANEYTVDDPTFRLSTETNPTESDVLERSFEDGAINPGIVRDTSKELEFIYDINYGTETSFRTYLNEFLYNARKIAILEDTVLNQQIPVEYISHEIGYDPGGFRKGAINTLVLRALSPFWEATTYTTDTDSGSTTITFPITNDGYVAANPVFTLTTAVNVTKFSIKNDVTNKGIVVQDLQFGLLGLTEYIVDCEEGTSELNGLSRESRIKGGTGFFSIPVGSSNIVVNVNGQTTVEVKYKKRYFI